ncbi:MAG: class I SAM-dependent methyltransferase [Lentisphaeria bacterium]|nr:class I SAM-dependent methyltransferase [Lentisphaeria bacterium]
MTTLFPLPRFMKSKKDLIRRHYEPLVRPGASHHEMLDWGSREAQLARFRVLAERLKAEGLFTTNRPPSLLDVGCGITDLKTFLDTEGLSVDYTGVDITPAILDQARTKHPDRKIIQADVFKDPPFPAAAFDVVFCSGTLNLKLGNNAVFAAEALAAMRKLAGKLLVVNFLHQRTRKKFSQCHYYSPDTIRETARRVAAPFLDLAVIDDYLENDFTLAIRINGDA